MEILITGPQGCGKTTLAEKIADLIAKAERKKNPREQNSVAIEDADEIGRMIYLAPRTRRPYQREVTAAPIIKIRIATAPMDIDESIRETSLTQAHRFLRGEETEETTSSRKAVARELVAMGFRRVCVRGTFIYRRPAA